MPKYRFSITVDTTLVPSRGGDADRRFVMDAILGALNVGSLDLELNEDAYDTRVTLTDYNLDPADRHARLTMLGRKSNA